MSPSGERSSRPPIMPPRPGYVPAGGSSPFLRAVSQAPAPIMPPRPGNVPAQVGTQTNLSLSAMAPIPTTDSPATDVRAPLYSLWDQGDEFLLAVEIPGADPHNIDLELNVTQLTIHASLSERFKHRRLGSYRGSLNLPESVEP